VSPDDLKLIKIVDTEEEVVEVLDAFYKKYNLKPNFNSKSCLRQLFFILAIYNLYYLLLVFTLTTLNNH
jgi:hypothetical protein